MRNILGSIFNVLGVIIWVIFGLWGFIIEVAIVNQVAGFWGLVVAFMLLPITLAVTPWYALVAWGNWFPLVIVYGGGIVGTLFFGIGSAIAGD